MEEEIIKAIADNRHTFQAILSDLKQEMVTWKPSEDRWCILEIVCHLFDEEVEDFRARVNHVLHTPEEPLTSINPVGWVTLRNYMEQDYQHMLSKFLDARQHSIDWLQALDSPNWNNTLSNSELGSMSARKFLTNWLAHDYHHFRQINQLKYLHLRHHSPEKLDYAGKW